MEAQRMDLLDTPDAGLLAWAQIKANSAVVTALEGAGGTDITGLSIAVTCDGNPIVLTLDGYASVISGSGIQYAVVRIMEGTTEIVRTALTAAATGTHFVPARLRARITPSAGSHTYKVNLFRITATSVMLAGSDTGTNQTIVSLAASKGALV